MAVNWLKLCRLTVAAAALQGAAPAFSEAQDYCRPGYARYCENAHVEDALAEDCADGWGLMTFLRDWHADYHRHRRDKRRHLYYKAQNAHYDLFYPRCPPDWSMTHGYHVTQWRPFPSDCDPRMMWSSPGVMPPAGEPGLLPTPAQPGTTPPAVPPVDQGNTPQPYSPPPVPEETPSAPSPDDPEPEIQLMDAERVWTDSIDLLPAADVSLRPSGIILLESTGDDWAPSRPH